MPEKKTQPEKQEAWHPDGDPTTAETTSLYMMMEWIGHHVTDIVLGPLSIIFKYHHNLMITIITLIS